MWHMPEGLGGPEGRDGSATNSLSDHLSETLLPRLQNGQNTIHKRVFPHFLQPPPRNAKTGSNHLC